MSDTLVRGALLILAAVLVPACGGADDHSSGCG